MNEIICTISNEDYIVEVAINEYDPGEDESVYTVSLSDEDATFQLEYFEAPNGTDHMDLIKLALQTLQEGVK